MRVIRSDANAELVVYLKQILGSPRITVGIAGTVRLEGVVMGIGKRQTRRRGIVERKIGRQLWMNFAIIADRKRHLALRHAELRLIRKNVDRPARGVAPVKGALGTL